MERVIRKRSIGGLWGYCYTKCSVDYPPFMTKMSISCITKFSMTLFDSRTTLIRKRRVYLQQWATYIGIANDKLLNREPEKRLGNAGAQEIKSHPFFASIDWKKLMAKRIQPPFKPSVVLYPVMTFFDFCRTRLSIHPISIRNSPPKLRPIVWLTIHNYLRQCNYSFKGGHIKEEVPMELEQASTMVHQAS
jgi:hypothetical protein